MFFTLLEKSKHYINIFSPLKSNVTKVLSSKPLKYLTGACFLVLQFQYIHMRTLQENLVNIKLFPLVKGQPGYI